MIGHAYNYRGRSMRAGPRREAQSSPLHIPLHTPTLQNLTSLQNYHPTLRILAFPQQLNTIPTPIWRSVVNEEALQIRFGDLDPIDFPSRLSSPSPPPATNEWGTTAGNYS